MDVGMEGRTEGIGKPRLLPLKELLSLSDPDLLGGNSCVLLELLNETPGVRDRLAKRQHLKTTMERIEKWNVPNSRALFCSLWEKNLDIEVLKKAQALVPAQSREMESEIVQRKAEGDKWKVELMKGIVFKMIKEIDSLEQEAQELEYEVAEKNLDIETIRRIATAETELRIASMEATATKAKEDELRIESLQNQLAEKFRASEFLEIRLKNQLAEKSRATELLEIRLKETTLRILSSMEAMSREVKDGEWKIELLQKQLAEKSEQVPEIRKVNMLADKFGETQLERACELAEMELEPAEEDLLMKEDSEDLRPAKRAKVEGGAEGIRMESAPDEDETDGKHQSENGGPNDKSNLNDNNHMQRDVGTNSADKEVDGRGHSSDGRVAETSDRDELQGGHVAKINDGDELQGGHVAERNDGDEVQGGGAAKKKDSHSSNSVEILRRTEDFAAAQESKLIHSQNVVPKIEKLPGNTPQDAKSPLSRDESHHEGEEFSKLVDKSSNKSPPRNVEMGSPQVPFGSQSVHEDDHMPQQRVSSPATPPPCHSKSSPSTQQDSKEGELQILVPDPDFHDFDSLRTETDILPGQIWAVYDDRDGMPRFYAHISTAQTKPFKVHVNWLEHCPATDQEIAWTESTGLSITCGDFKMGGADVIDRINTFSHCVVDKVGGGLLKIYPKKGQVWAVYRDLEQGIGPAGGPRYPGGGSTVKFEMVEILSEFCDKNGLRTGTLVKVMGFTAVFRRQDGIKEAFRSFKPEELAKFSHNVPNQRIEDSETEAHGIPRGSLELDPAAIPLDRVISPPVPSRVQTNTFHEKAGKGTIEGSKVHGESEKPPKWVQLLNPIAKLPTNVGSRIRNRVRDALEAGPPEWAVELLEQSISSEVYKGNAAGPTKRMVIDILNKVRGEISRSGSTQS